MINLFKTHYSLSSILTLDKIDKTKTEIDKKYPISVCEIARHHKLEHVFLVEDSMAGFIEAYKNMPCPFSFGWRVVCCENIENKNPESLDTEHKLVIFAKNTQGYRDLIRIHNKASVFGKYYVPRIDFKILKEFWTENLLLAVPFYDSFIYRNSFTMKSCFVDFGDIKPLIFLENHSLPFDLKLNELAAKYAKTFGLKTEEVNSVYYYERSDFLPYMTYRCLHNRSTWSKPELQFMSSDDFCYIK